MTGILEYLRQTNLGIAIGYIAYQDTQMNKCLFHNTAKIQVYSQTTKSTTLFFILMQKYQITQISAISVGYNKKKLYICREN